MSGDFADDLANQNFSQWDFMPITHRIHVCYIYMVTWIPSIYPLYVSIYTSTMDPSWVIAHDDSTALSLNTKWRRSHSVFRQRCWARLWFWLILGIYCYCIGNLLPVLGCNRGYRTLTNHGFKLTKPSYFIPVGLQNDPTINIVGARGVWLLVNRW